MMAEEPSYVEEDEDEYLFNEYSIDDTLDSLTRLERYYHSDFSLQRMVLVRDILDTAKEAGHKRTLVRLLPLLPAFVNDSEPAVRQTLADQMYGLAEFTCTGGETDEDNEEGYKEVLNSFLPYLIELLSDKNSEVGSSAVQALLRVCQLVRPEQFEAHVLTVIKQLAEDERAEGYRIIAAELCNELAPLLGRELCIEKIVPIVEKIADDTGFSVRKTVAAHLGKLCKTVGPEAAVQRIFPLYKTLAGDMIWGVRKACAETITDISEALTAEIREGPLVQLFNQFLEDISRWVRVAASNNLGRYLYTFGPDACPASLVRLFTRLAYDSEPGSDTDYPEYCAYNFPAVAHTIGPARWGELQDAFLHLVKDVQWKVRKSLSFSLHEIAKIVGQEITETVLSRAFDMFMMDLDEVKVGCLEHVADFLAVMGPEKREQYIPKLCSLKDQAESWRLRMLIGSTFGDLAQLVSPAFTAKHIVPVCTAMMDDSVSDVRQATFSSTAKVLKRLCEGEQNEVDELMTPILVNSYAKSFQKRQMLPYIAMEVVKTGNIELFESRFVEPLVTTSQDTVANVRLILAKCASEILKDEAAKENEAMLKMMETLKQDTDRDVAFFAGNTEPRAAIDPLRLENEEQRRSDLEEVENLRRQQHTGATAPPPPQRSTTQPQEAPITSPVLVGTLDGGKVVYPPGYWDSEEGAPEGATAETTAETPAAAGEDEAEAEVVPQAEAEVEVEAAAETAEDAGAEAKAKAEAEAAETAQEEEEEAPAAAATEGEAVVVPQAEAEAEAEMEAEAEVDAEAEADAAAAAAATPAAEESAAAATAAEEGAAEGAATKEGEETTTTTTTQE